VSELEHALVALGHELAVPEAPNLAPRVLATLEPPARRPGMRLAVVLVAVLAAALLAALAVPEARSALARFFHIGAARIEVVDELPAVEPQPPELDLEPTLGERVTLAEARRRAGYDLLELDEAPDRVYLGPRDSVWFLYGRPDAVRLLVAQTPKLSIDQGFIFKKLAAVGTNVETVSVRGKPAYFLSGEPHEVMLVDEYDLPVQESLRLARNTLLWEEDGRTLRLEGDLSREEAVRIAESLR
jgi:Domain of unknown function (DUF4367)